jgi:glycosyltransferase involved in cell wall biosynthesis
MDSPAAGQATPGRRVLMVSGPAEGGIRSHLEVLARELPPRGWDVALAAPETLRLAGQPPRFPLSSGDRPRPLADLRSILRLASAARSWRPDLVHAHGVKAALLSLVAFSGGSPPVVVTLHNLWRGTLRVSLGAMLPRAAGVVTVSQAAAASFEGLIREPVVIPNGIDMGHFSPAPEPRLERPFTLAFAGRLTVEKGVLVLLDAVRRLPREPEVQLLIAGDGPLRPDVEAEARRPGWPVTYLGPREDVLAVYHQADGVVVPSLAEGFGLSALEGMACGLPVIATRVGGLPELVLDRETGLLVPPGDPAALAAGMVRLATEPALAARLGAAARRRAGSAYSQERMLQALLAVYRQSLRGPCTR